MLEPTRPPARSRRLGIRALASLTLVAGIAAGGQVARADTAPEFDPFNFAFSHYQGSGYYAVDGRQALIFAFLPRYTIRKPAEHLVGSTLRFGYSLGFCATRVEDFFEFGFPDHVSTFAFVPGIEFPVHMAKEWVLAPLLDVGGTYNSDAGWAGMGAVGVRSRAVLPTEPVTYVLYNRLLYARNGAAGESDEGVPIEATTFLQLRTELDVRRLGGTHSIGDREFDFALYVRNDFYPATLEILRLLEDPQKVRMRWQLGFTWGPLEEWWPWWKVKVPRIGLAALFGDGTAGYRFIFRFAY